jgi:hypothetical protein
VGKSSEAEGMGRPALGSWADVSGTLSCPCGHSRTRGVEGGGREGRETPYLFKAWWDATGEVLSTGRTSDLGSERIAPAPVCRAEVVGAVAEVGDQVSFCSFQVRLASSGPVDSHPLMSSQHHHLLSHQSILVTYR